MTRKLFYGLGVWVGKTVGQEQAEVWVDKPESLNPPYDPKKLIPVDLNKRPKNATTDALWAAVEVDDHVYDHGSTTLGPSFPQGSLVGGIYVTKEYLDKNKLPVGAVPALFDAQPYEFQVVVERNAAAQLRRYRGVHAHVIHVDRTGVPLVVLFPPGSSGDDRPDLEGMPLVWLELSDASKVDPAANGLTKLEAKVGSVGPIFLEESIYNKYFTYGPKIPAGSDTVRRALIAAAPDPSDDVLPLPTTRKLGTGQP